MNHYTMKFLILLLFPALALAQGYKSPYNQHLTPPGPKVEKQESTSEVPWQCKYADTVLVFEFGDWDIFPKSAHVKEGDKVCLVFRASGSKGATFRVENLPVGGSVSKGNDRIFSFVAKTVRKHKVQCVGTCQSAEAYIEVVSKAEFQRLEDEINKYRSIQTRPTHILGN